MFMCISSVFVCHDLCAIVISLLLLYSLFYVPLLCMLIINNEYLANYENIYTVSQKEEKKEILLQYGITNHICKLLHLHQTIG